MKRLLLQLTLASAFVLPALAQPAPVTNAAPAVPFPSPKPQQPAAFSVVNNPNVITPAEWQELNGARQKAMNNNPALMAKSVALSRQMHDFMDKLNAAILQTDPTVAPVIARMQGHRPGPGGGMQPFHPGQSPHPMQPPPAKPQ